MVLNHAILVTIDNRAKVLTGGGGPLRLHSNHCGMVELGGVLSVSLSIDLFHVVWCFVSFALRP